MTLHPGISQLDYTIQRCEYLERRVKELEVAIRLHRDQKGDDRCWMDDANLYMILPEGYSPPTMDTAVELYNCEKFIASRRDPLTKYWRVSLTFYTEEARG